MPIEDELPIFGTNIDESQVPPIHQKRIVAFVNTFLMKTAEFLDQFATICEERFIEVEGKLNRMEAVLSLLETKLDSVPDLKNLNIQTKSAKEIQEKIEQITSAPVINEEIDEKSSPVKENVVSPTFSTTETEEKSPEPESSGGVKAKDDYRYKKYYKMVHFGVPPAAIKQKMQAEGVDPNLLDNPDLILPDGILEPPMLEDDGSSGEESN